MGIKQGNESLAMYWAHEHPSLNLFDERFDNNNDSVLHVAVRNKAYKLIVYLLSQGVSPDLQNEEGDTSFHIAVRQRELKIVALLSKENADPNVTNNNSETALMIAMENRDADIIELLSPTTKCLIDDHIKRNTHFLGLQTIELNALSNSIPINHLTPIPSIGRT